MAAKLECEFVEDTEIATSNLNEIAPLVKPSPSAKPELKFY